MSSPRIASCPFWISSRMARPSYSYAASALIDFRLAVKRHWEPALLKISTRARVNPKISAAHPVLWPVIPAPVTVRHDRPRSLKDWEGEAVHFLVPVVVLRPQFALWPPTPRCGEGRWRHPHGRNVTDTSAPQRAEVATSWDPGKLHLCPDRSAWCSWTR